jgi:hypothetical protein
LISRLVAQEDEVRVVEDEPERAAVWRELGAYVALGEWEEDLIERAAQNARTMVIFDTAPSLEPWLIEQLVTGARLAGVDRVVLCTPKAGWGEGPPLERSTLEYIVLETGKQRGLFGRRGPVSPEHLAVAIDAADDVAGEFHTVLDLTKEKSWRTLGLEPPG